MKSSFVQPAGGAQQKANAAAKKDLTAPKKAGAAKEAQESRRVEKICREFAKIQRVRDLRRETRASTMASAVARAPAPDNAADPIACKTHAELFWEELVKKRRRANQQVKRMREQTEHAPHNLFPAHFCTGEVVAALEALPILHPLGACDALFFV